MRIVYLYQELAFWGGADRVITEKANYLADICNYEVFMVTTCQNHPIVFPLSPNVKHIDMGINFYEQYKYPLIKRIFIYLKLIRKYRRELEKLLKSIKPDITITTLCKDLDVITSIKDGSFKIAEAHLAKEFVRDLHIYKRKSLPYKIMGKILSCRTNRAIKKLDGFVVLSNSDAYNWREIREATVIPNSLPFYPSETSKCEHKKIISIGRLEEQKGYDMLIKAWSIVHHKHLDWEINIFGKGTLKKRLDIEIEKEGITNSFIIKEPVQNIVEKYIESSFYVMSSRFEGFGMVLIEAMACGLPVISFDCPDGPSDIISDNEDGILVKNGNIEELAEKICFLIENDEIRRKMGEAARKNVKRYMPDVVMQEWILLFKSLNNAK
ncbi:glycosyltransferase family 4 protein [Bacteroides sedimenti]|uniref:Glycosyl transferase n=1 Tax=Bacteroides sedimenti TaxID=2136147 RepID=A0ABN6Z2N1_9BACE